MNIVLFFLLILMSTGTYCQNNLKPLKPGDQFPAVIGRDTNKWTLLDFWGIYCTVCIEKMPEMEMLQQKFSHKLDIVFVTKYNDSSVNQLFRRVTIKKPSMKFINNDSILGRLFPYLSMPHHVWITPSGKVEYITHHHNTTEKNVQQLLAGKRMNFASTLR